MLPRVDERLKQEFYDNSSSPWQDLIKAIPSHQSRAKSLLKKIVVTLSDDTLTVLNLSLFDYPELYKSVFVFIRQQVFEAELNDDDAIAAFLWQLKEEKSMVDAKRPLKESVWLPGLEQSVFTRQIWQAIEKRRHSLIKDFLIKLSRKLAQPPHKVAIAKLSFERIDALILEISAHLEQKTHFSDKEVDHIFQSFIEEDDKHSRTLKVTTFARGIDSRESGPLKKHKDFDSHLLTATHIQKALSSLESERVLRLGPYFTGRLDSSFRAFCEPECLPRLLIEPRVEKIFFPAGDGGHWRGVLLEKDGKQLTLSLFDSYGRRSALLIEAEIRQLISECLTSASSPLTLTKKTKFIRPKHTQTNWYSCGHYVVAFAHHLFREEQIPGFDEKVAQSYKCNQRKITDVVIDYHDSFYPVEETPAKPPSPAPLKTFNKPSVKPPSTAHPNVRHMFRTASVSSANMRPTLASHRKSEPNNGFLSFHQRHGGAVKTVEEQLRERCDVKALQTIIDDMQQAYKDSCFFWLRWASLEKAYALQTQLDRFVASKSSKSLHVLEDKLLAKAVDHYRYFGFFNRLTHKKTHTRQLLEKPEYSLAKT